MMDLKVTCGIDDNLGVRDLALHRRFLDGIRHITAQRNTGSNCPLPLYLDNVVKQGDNETRYDKTGEH